MGRGSENGAFFLGLALLVVGVGATVFSYTHTAPGGTYFIFGGLILGGLVRMVTAVMGGMGSNAFPTRRDKHRADAEKSAWYDDPNAQYVEKLADVPSGYCWQCGSKLRRGRSICMACGAAQNTTAPERTSTATPGGMTFGPPPKQARAGHPYDTEADSPDDEGPEPNAPRRPRTFYPADPDGSYGWGPAYQQGEDRGGRTSPGAAQGERAGRMADERRPRPAAGRDNPRGGRSNAGSARPNDRPPLDRGLREPRRDDPAPRRTGPLPDADDADDADQRTYSRRPRADGRRWDAETESGEDDDSREWRQNARRQAMRPRPRPRRPDVDDEDEWDNGYTPPRSPGGR